METVSFQFLFNKALMFVGHFVLSPWEREKRNRRAIRWKKREQIEQDEEKANDSAETYRRNTSTRFV